MIDDRQEELAALHALGLLEDGEREPFVAELGRSSELRKRVGDLRQCAAALAYLAPDAVPPDALKARILASAGASAGRAAAPETAPAVPARETGRRLGPAWVPWLAAACFGAALVWAERLYFAARSEVESLRDQQRLAELTLAQARAQLEDGARKLAASERKSDELGARLKAEAGLARLKIAALAPVLGDSAKALAVAVWDPAREEGVLAVSRLPAAAAEKDYQIWVIDAGYPAPVSGGVFAVDPATGEARVAFRANRPVRAVAKFAVSLERKGGVRSREGPIVLLGPP